ncbi:MAG TPA: LUD domain-containing protein [Rhizomicrobium sp.]|nr:LUD domain-containing protein [Rhizomicrobium sp.]
MSAREDILSDIRARRSGPVPKPAPYLVAPPGDDLAGHFADRARGAAARVSILGGADEIPAVIADVLRARNLPAIVHLPPDPSLDNLAWSSAPGLTLVHNAPGPDDTAVGTASFAIAETGTLVYTAAAARPASWHFRPGLEIALVAAESIQADLEQVLTRMKQRGALPSTINLVTGPSRTGDIEQTLELGAHGPKELVILIVPILGSEGT